MFPIDTEKILSYVDHTLLTQTATFKDITEILDDAFKYKVASVCIPPSYVKFAKEYIKGKVQIGTVVGFPNGYATTEIKVMETKAYLNDGADEIDMVIHIGMLKNKAYDYILDEIKQIKAVCGDKILKVIIETCLLSDEEKIKMCEIVSLSGADFIKTSTGFSSAGATFDDIALFKKHVAKNVCIKAAGGITSLVDAQKFIALGASRLGTSRIIKIINSQESSGY